MVTNPYAIKKNSATATTTHPSNTTTTPHAPPSLPQPPQNPTVAQMPAPKYTTFSQAFGPTEEEEDDVPVTTTTMDTATALATTSSAFTTDRDYHVLQQQPHVLYVSTKQHGNPILQYIRNVPFTYTRMVPDYIFSNTSCAIYLSAKYHVLYRNYIHTRIAALKTDFTCRVLLLYLDMDDNEKILHDINLICVQHNLTLILGWSEMEMARYIETFKVLQNRDATSIQKPKDHAHSSLVDQMMDVLMISSKTTRINRIDAATLLTQFQSLSSILQATPDQLSLVTGLGPTKVQRLHETFHQPFSTKLARQRSAQTFFATRNEGRRLPHANGGEG